MIMFPLNLDQVDFTFFLSKMCNVQKKDDPGRYYFGKQCRTENAYAGHQHNIFT